MRGGIAPMQLNALLAWLQRNLHVSLTVRDMAARVGLSAAHFSREFKRSTGSTPWGYVTQLRLDGARRLLETGESVGEVAVRYGFADQAHLSRLRVSGSALRGRVQHIDRCCNWPLKIRPGNSHILRSMFDLILSEKKALQPNQSHHLGSMLVELIARTAMEAPELESFGVLDDQSSDKRVFERALDYISRQLGNSGLDAESIAHHCNISRRKLYAIFSDREVTVGGVIRELRLVRCREALENPLLGERSVLDIALDLGFSSSSTFYRLYKVHFGKNPSQERHQ